LVFYKLFEIDGVKLAELGFKIWQFKTLIKNTDDENPLRTLEREKFEKII